MAQKNTLAVESRFPNMPGKTADLDQTWAYLTSGVDHIMTNIEAGLSFADYTNLYTTVYNYCTSTKMHSRLEIGNRSTCRMSLSTLARGFSFFPVTDVFSLLAGANLVGSDLYNKLSGYFVHHFRAMKEVCAHVCSLPIIHGL
jgi:cullin 1